MARVYYHIILSSNLWYQSMYIHTETPTITLTPARPAAARAGKFHFCTVCTQSTQSWHNLSPHRCHPPPPSYTSPVPSSAPLGTACWLWINPVVSHLRAGTLPTQGPPSCLPSLTGDRSQSRLSSWESRSPSPPSQPTGAGPADSSTGRTDKVNVNQAPSSGGRYLTCRRKSN